MQAGIYDLLQLPLSLAFKFSIDTQKQDQCGTPNKEIWVALQ
jgi:hypothetical protein